VTFNSRSDGGELGAEGSQFLCVLLAHSFV
jgi:hypothetical protein